MVCDDEDVVGSLAAALYNLTHLHLMGEDDVRADAHSDLFPSSMLLQIVFPQLTCLETFVVRCSCW